MPFLSLFFSNSKTIVGEQFFVAEIFNEICRARNHKEYVTYSINLQYYRSETDLRTQVIFWRA